MGIWFSEVHNYFQIHLVPVDFSCLPLYVHDKPYTENISVSLQTIVRRCRCQCEAQTWLDSTDGGSHQPKQQVRDLLPPSLCQNSADHYPEPSPTFGLSPCCLLQRQGNGLSLRDCSSPGAMEHSGDVEWEALALDPSSIIHWLCDRRWVVCFTEATKCLRSLLLGIKYTCSSYHHDSAIISFHVEQSAVTVPSKGFFGLFLWKFW